MRTFYTILFVSSCLFYSCLETDDFEILTENLKENAISLNNPIRFGQLAVGQKSRYVLTRIASCGMPDCCQQMLDTLRIEIIEQDTNGYLLKETTTLPNHNPLFFYLKYETKKVIRDTLEGEPSIKEYDELYTIKTQTIGDNRRSYLYGTLGAKLYLNSPQHISLIPMELDNLCEVFFLPMRADDLLPTRDDAHHSELGIINEYNYKGNCFGDLLIMNHDYGYPVDAINYTFGYSLEAGLVFGGTFNGGIPYGEPWVWHIIPDN